MAAPPSGAGVGPTAGVRDVRDASDTPCRAARARRTGTGGPDASAAGRATEVVVDRAAPVVSSTPPAGLLVADPVEPGDRTDAAGDGDAGPTRHGPAPATTRSGGTCVVDGETVGASVAASGPAGAGAGVAWTGAGGAGFGEGAGDCDAGAAGGG